MDHRSSGSANWARRLFLVFASLVVGAVGWFLLGEPETLGAAETVRPAPAELLARVDGVDITRSQLAGDVADELERLEQRRRQLLADAVETRVCDVLIEAEAARRGVDREQLLELEVESKLDRVSDAEVAAWAAEHGGDVSDVEIRRQLRRRAFVEHLQQRAQVEVFAGGES